MSSANILTTAAASSPTFTFPKLLQPGDTVSLVSCSNAVTADMLESAKQSVLALGFKPIYREDILAQDGQFSGTPERRFAELNEALADSRSQAIWTVSGGFGAGHLLDGLDAAVIKRANKLLIGMSDTTVLQAAWERAGVASLYALPAKYLGQLTPDTRSELLSYLTQDTPHVLDGVTVAGGQAVQGFLTGGNLSMLTSLAGTGYLPCWDGAVVFFEDVNEAPYRLERMLLQLYQANAFTGVRGIVIGQCTDCVNAHDVEEVEAMTRMTEFLRKRLSVPILRDIQVGHFAETRPLLLGAHVILDPTAATLTVYPHKR